MSSNKRPPLDSRVQLERVRLLFGHAQGNWATTILAIVLISNVLYDAGASLSFISVWAFMLALSTVVLLVYEKYVRGIGITAENSQQILRKRFFFGGSIAVVYGCSDIVMPIAALPVEGATLFIILLTTVYIATFGYAVMPRYYFQFNVLCLFPITTVFAVQYWQLQDRHYLLLFFISVVSQVAIFRKAKLVSRSVVGAIILNQNLHDEIEEHKRTKAVIQHMALHDTLTDIANRRYFEEELLRTIAAAKRQQSRFGLLIIDLNGFKPVNDKYGHIVGDALLKAVANRMVKAIRTSDFCARVGGDEFSVIVKELQSLDDAFELKRKLRDVLAEPFDIEGRTIFIGGCIGCAAYPDDGATVDELIVDADAKMYLEKQSMSVLASSKAQA